ncbi:MAG TPA: MlrC C-terminal domain-containing protein [Acetobacteraceae bacterium]|nr:MlrC C-terminal domain-containing protein [Acetobacteraceae bacterium]
MGEQPYLDRVLNVSVMAGFAYADTPFNGLTVVVTATDQQAANDLAREIAEAGWTRRERFRPVLTSLEEATRLAKAIGAHTDVPCPTPRSPVIASEAKQSPADDRSSLAGDCFASLAMTGHDPALTGHDPAPTGHDPALTGHDHALAFADVADNPGGGGRGTTMWLLEAFHNAGVRDALAGVIHDPALAAEAHRHGEGARFTARFNRDGGDEFSHPFAASAKVRRLRSGTVRGRRGYYADNTLDLGPSAALDLNGVSVVVLSNRYQCADPIFFEAFGLDIAAARVVVVTSRGHFRGGFDEYFRHEDIIEVDAPGLTSPILSRFAWRHMPRPVLPIDGPATWTLPA